MNIVNASGRDWPGISVRRSLYTQSIAGLIPSLLRLEKEARDGCHRLLRRGLWRRFAEHINSVSISSGEKCDSDGWVLALSKGEVRETVQWRH